MKQYATVDKAPAALIGRCAKRQLSRVMEIDWNAAPIEGIEVCSSLSADSRHRRAPKPQYPLSLIQSPKAPVTEHLPSSHLMAPSAHETFSLNKERKWLLNFSDTADTLLVRGVIAPRLAASRPTIHIPNQYRILGCTWRDDLLGKLYFTYNKRNSYFRDAGPMSQSGCSCLGFSPHLYSGGFLLVVSKYDNEQLLRIFCQESRLLAEYELVGYVHYFSAILNDCLVVPSKP